MLKLGVFGDFWWGFASSFGFNPSIDWDLALPHSRRPKNSKGNRQKPKLLGIVKFGAKKGKMSRSEAKTCMSPPTLWLKQAKTPFSILFLSKHLWNQIKLGNEKKEINQEIQKFLKQRDRQLKNHFPLTFNLKTLVLIFGL